MTVGENIKKLRRERNITQEALAEYLRISSQAVSQWKCGKTPPNIAQIPVLAYIFGVSADAILGIDIDALFLIKISEPNSLSLVLIYKKAIVRKDKSPQI